MFTGIVEETGKVIRIKPGKTSTELSIRAGKVARKLRRGDSIALNGVCLTVVSKRGHQARFDVLNETLRRSNFGELSPVR